MSALPKAIQDQVEQAEALQAQLYPVDSVPDTSEPLTDVPEAEATPSNVVELTKPQTPPEPAPPPAREESVDYWKSRFETMRGKFDAEVPALHQQLKEQSSQLQKLMDKLNDQPTPERKEEALVSDEDRSEYGEDYVNFIERVSSNAALRAATQMAETLRKEFSAVREQIGQVADHVVKTDVDKFWDSVMSLVPNWKQIDSDPRWFDWLETSPDFTEETYRDLAGKAIAKRNAEKIAKLVKVWEAEMGLSTAPTPIEPAKSELAGQVAPSSSKSSAPASPGPRMWTKAEYEAAYDPRNVARYGVQKANEMLADADRAVAEGRVNWR